MSTPRQMSRGSGWLLGSIEARAVSTLTAARCHSNTTTPFQRVPSMTSILPSLLRLLPGLWHRSLPLAALAALALPEASQAQQIGSIRNSASWQCMDVSYDRGGDRFKVAMQSGCRDVNSQKWRALPVGDGYYKLQVNWECLDVNFGRTEPGTQLIQHPCGDGENQQFMLRPQHDGFALVARNSGLCVTMEGWPWATGNRLVQQPCNGETGQTWQVPVTTVLQSAGSGQCMDVDKFSREWWAPINQWGCHGGTNQQWDLEQVDGWYMLKSVNSGHCLEVPAATWDSGAGLQQWGCNPAAWNQQFRIRSQGGGFSLVARHSGKCVAVGRGSKEQGARLTQEGCDAPSSWLTWNIGTPAAAQTAVAYRPQGFTFFGLTVSWGPSIRICIWPFPCLELPGGSSGYAQTRYPVVLIHGLSGAGTIAGQDYFYDIPNNLRRDGATVYTPTIPAFNSNEARGEELLRILRGLRAAHGHQKFNLIGHSQGGLNARYVAAVDPGLVASVTTVATPHTGSRTADAIQAAGRFAGPALSAPLAAAAEGLGRLVALLSANPGLPQDGFAALDSLTSAGMNNFNWRFQKAHPFWTCGPGPEVVDGQRFYSVGGVVTLTNVFDISDPILKVAGSPFGWEPNDGLVSQCSSHWGAVIKDDFGWNHLDSVNQLFGLRGFWSSDPVAFYRSHVNRLKGVGL